MVKKVLLIIFLLCLGLLAVCHHAAWVVCAFLALSILINLFDKHVKIRNVLIVIVAIFYTGLFHYESARYFFLNELAGKSLPKTKYVLPPAGWIMFYNVDDQFGYIEVYSEKDGKTELIDPHEIFKVRTIMYDNIKRNILSRVANKNLALDFCNHLDKRFTDRDNFYVVTKYYPSLIKKPDYVITQMNYKCRE